MERGLDVASPEKAEDSRVLGVDCNVEDHIVVTSTGRVVGNADYLNHKRREFKNGVPACNRPAREAPT